MSHCWVRQCPCHYTKPYYVGLTRAMTNLNTDTWTLRLLISPVFQRSRLAIDFLKVFVRKRFIKILFYYLIQPRDISKCVNMRGKKYLHGNYTCPPGCCLTFKSDPTETLPTWILIQDVYETTRPTSELSFPVPTISGKKDAVTYTMCLVYDLPWLNPGCWVCRAVLVC